VQHRFRQLDKNYIIGFRVRASLGEDQRQDILKALTSISSKNIRYSQGPAKGLDVLYANADQFAHPREFITLARNETTHENNRVLTIDLNPQSDGFNYASSQFHSYLLSRIGLSQSLDRISKEQIISSSANDYRGPFPSDLALSKNALGSCQYGHSPLDNREERLIVSALSKDGEVLETFQWGYSGLRKNIAGDILILGWDNTTSRPWQLLHRCNLFATFQRSFWVLLSFKPDVIRNVSSINLKLER